MILEDKKSYMVRAKKDITFEGRACIITAKYGLDYLGSNKHSYWSVTGRISVKTPQNKQEREDPCIMCGCIHEQILEYFPELKPFVALHNSDFDGSPQYAAENGWYHAGGCNTDRLIGGKCPGQPDVLASHLRIDLDYATQLCEQVAAGLWTQNGFVTYIKQNYTAQWHAETEAAKQLLADAIQAQEAAK